MVEQLREKGEGIEEHPEEEGNPVLAIGFYIAAVVLVIGAMLTLNGLFGSPDNSKSLGINVNLWWGLFMVFVGSVAFGLSHASRARAYCAS